MKLYKYRLVPELSSISICVVFIFSHRLVSIIYHYNVYTSQTSRLRTLKMDSSLASQSVPLEPQPTFMTKAFITALADVRILIGAAAIILPLPAASLFGLPIASASRGIAQFYGARELGMLWPVTI